MKAYGGVAIQLVSLLTFAQDGGEWLTSCPSGLTWGGGWGGIGGWMGPGADLEALKEKKSTSIPEDRTTIFLFNMLPGHFTDVTVAAQILENSNWEMFLFSKHTLRFFYVVC
jgi:hypothetical protein